MAFEVSEEAKRSVNGAEGENPRRERAELYQGLLRQGPCTARLHSQVAQPG